MKKLFYLLILLLTTLTYSQTVTVNYTPSTNIIANPERGLQKYSKTGSNYYTTANASNITQATITNWRTGADKVTVIYRYFMLENFLNSDINTTYLNNIQGDFDKIRNAGLKVIVRFAYTDEEGTTAQQPTKAQILTHISQLGPILNTNKDIILSQQAGFIGTWGEWYYTNSSEFGTDGTISNTQWTARKEILTAMLAATPIEIPIQVRYVGIKTKLYGTTQLTPTTAYQNTANARLGFYNDAFLNSWGDMGTYENSGSCTNPVGTPEYIYLSNETKYLPMTGESNGLNSCNSGFRTTGANAITELGLTNFTTLNRDYHPDVWGGWSTAEYTAILKGLGYRFELESSTFNKVNNNLNVSLTINNTGYARIFKARKVYLILKNTTNTYQFELNTDIRTWENQTIINETIDISSLALGNYNAYLWLPDTNLSNRSEYSIQLANVGLWDNITAYNNLNQTVNITSLGSCSTPTVWNGSTWSLGVPSPTISAQIDGPMTIVSGQGFDCCYLIVNSNLTINNNAFVTFQNDITINSGGNVTVNSGGKLIPVNNTSMCYGNVTVQRTTTPLKMYDYTYWGSPVYPTTIGSTLLNSNWEENHTLELITSNFYDIQTQYGTTITAGPDAQDDDNNAWQIVPPSTIMEKGKGYASMVLQSGSFPRTETVSFTGVLNTGIITKPLVLSQNTLDNDDDYNFVSNPYSSSIFAISFIQDNLPNISGTLSFWTHTGTLSSAYSGLALLNFSSDDFAYLTQLGSTNSAFGGKYPADYIGSCQGFYVDAETTQSLIFKPSYMAAGYTNSTNGVFFRTNESKKIWLNLTTELGLYSNQLIGYNSNTDLTYNKGWDAKQSVVRTPVKFYSIENNIKYKIQSRGEFNENDIVKLGYYSAVQETYTISIDNILGVENAYIKDNGVIHTLPYTFTSEVGEFNDRFELVYSNLLNTENPITNKEIKIYPNPTTNDLYIKNFNGKIIKIYDILGKNYKIEYFNNDKNIIVLNTSILKKGLYLLRLDNKTYRFIKK